jgi:nicotinamide riboside kinase
MSTEILVITGPESSGKTTLATQLANYWKTPLVTEASRDYLNGKDSYQQHDLLKIAKQQHKQEQTVLSYLPEKIICDTDLLVIMIWSEVRYGHCDPWIYSTFENSIKKNNFPGIIICVIRIFLGKPIHFEKIRTTATNYSIYIFKNLKSTNWTIE